VAAFAVLEPLADGFRNYTRAGDAEAAPARLVDKAQLLTLTAPQMTVLIGGLRVLQANFDHSQTGVFTDRPGVLTPDFFVNLLDMKTTWQKSATQDGLYEGLDRASGAVKWTGSSVDLVFGYNAQLRGLAEFYASSDAPASFVHDFVAAWSKAMHLDRFDLKA
jgi:catalase-peroxidase